MTSAPPGPLLSSTARHRSSPAARSAAEAVMNAAVRRQPRDHVVDRQRPREAERRRLRGAELRAVRQRHRVCLPAWRARRPASAACRRAPRRRCRAAGAGRARPPSPRRRSLLVQTTPSRPPGRSTRAISGTARAGSSQCQAVETNTASALAVRQRHGLAPARAHVHPGDRRASTARIRASGSTATTRAARPAAPW